MDKPCAGMVKKAANRLLSANRTLLCVEGVAELHDVSDAFGLKRRRVVLLVNQTWNVHCSQSLIVHKPQISILSIGKVSTCRLYARIKDSY